MKNRNTTFILVLLIGCFATWRFAQAVVPPPDGGYPGGNTAEGQNALFSLTANGLNNTAVGFLSLRSNKEGDFNTALGSGALFTNTADGNTAVGGAALLLNTIGSANTAVGAAALLHNVDGGANTATGFQALFKNNATGNTANGRLTLFTNTEGAFNTAVGDRALLSHTTGDNNTAIGASALINDTTGTNNTATGAAALFNNTTGSFNIALGNNAGSSITTANNVICIGHQGANVNDSCYIGNIFQTDAIHGDPVYVTSEGKLGTLTIPSSARFKEEIKPMNKASEVLFALKPVTFRYKEEFDPRRISQFGLVAEEVEKINPDLVKRDRNGKLQTVRYEVINAMLLNEFLKEHRRVEEQDWRLQKQEAAIVNQQKQIEALTAGLQRVSAQIEATKATPSLVINNP